MNLSWTRLQRTNFRTVMRANVRTVMRVALAGVMVAAASIAGPGGTAGAQAAGPTAVDPARGDVRLVVLGDFNGPYGSLEYPPALARAMAAITGVWLPDLVLSPGDVIAGQNRELPDDRFAAMWAAFDETVAEPLRRTGVPYAVAMGNHDASSQVSLGEYAFARERRAAVDYWLAHEPALSLVDRTGYPFDFSFKLAVKGVAELAAPARPAPATASNAAVATPSTAAVAPPSTPTMATPELFVIVLDASSSSVTPDQRSWLAAQLSSAAAVDAAARIVVGHLPLVPVSQGRDGPGEYVYQGVELGEVLAAGAVDLYVSGHHAAYYPGRLSEVEMLFAGGIGGRRLLGSSLEPRSTVTVVDIWIGDKTAQPTFAYTTFDLATMAVVDPNELPRAIGTVVLSGRVGATQLALGEEQ